MKIKPILASLVDAKGLSTVIKEAGGKSPLHDTQHKSGNILFDLQALGDDSLDLSSWPLSVYQLGFCISGPTHEISPLLSLGFLTTRIIVSSESTVLILVGSLFDWYCWVISGCKHTSHSMVLEAASQVLLAFDRMGLSDMFKTHNRVSVEKGVYLT